MPVLPRKKSKAALGAARSHRRNWCERCRESVKTELAIQIAARAGVKLIKACDGAKHPGRIHRFAQRFQSISKAGVAENGLLDFGRQLEQVGEQSVEDLKLLLEGRFSVLRQSRCARKQLRETLPSRCVLQDAQRVPSFLRCGGYVHFHGQ